jgi:hypothetical protein
MIGRRAPTSGRHFVRGVVSAPGLPKLGPMTTIAAVLICVVLGLLTVFQLLLIAGVPIGRFAWGGKQTVLPRNLRIGSAVSILLYVLFAIIVLDAAKLTDVFTSDTFTFVAMWVLTGYFTLGVFMNAISRSKPERFTMTPVSLVLAGLCLIVAIA